MKARWKPDWGHVTGAGDASRTAVVARGGPDGGRLTFVESGPGCYTATLCSAGVYVLSATFGGKLAPGWPLCLTVVPASEGPVCLVIRGDALSGVTCGRAATLTLSTADNFGNLRCG